MQSGVTDNLLTLDVNMYVQACETGRLYHIKKNFFAKWNFFSYSAIIIIVLKLNPCRSEIILFVIINHAL